MVASSSSGLRRSTSVPGFGTVVHSVHPKPLPLPQSSPKVKQTGVKSKTPTRGRTPPPAVSSATLSGASDPSGADPPDTTIAIAATPVPTAVVNGADVEMVTPAGAPGVSDPSGGASGEGPVVDQGGTKLTADQQLDAMIAAHNAVQKNPPRKGASPLPLPKFAQLPNADGGGLATLAGAGHPPEAAAAAALPPVPAPPLPATAPVPTPHAHAVSTDACVSACAQPTKSNMVTDTSATLVGAGGPIGPSAAAQQQQLGVAPAIIGRPLGDVSQKRDLPTAEAAPKTPRQNVLLDADLLARHKARQEEAERDAQSPNDRPHAHRGCCCRSP